jgi:endoglucanase
MRINDILLGAAAVASVVAAPATSDPTPTSTKKRAKAFQFVGVNESGAEFGNKNLPGLLGKDYTWPVHSAIDVGSC